MINEKPDRIETPPSSVEKGVIRLIDVSQEGGFNFGSRVFEIRFFVLGKVLRTIPFRGFEKEKMVVFCKDFNEKLQEEEESMRFEEVRRSFAEGGKLSGLDLEVEMTRRAAEILKSLKLDSENEELSSILGFTTKILISYYQRIQEISKLN